MRGRGAGLVLWGGLAVAAFSSSKAKAEDGVAQCLAAAETGQELRGRGKLLGARIKFRACAANVCPKLVADRCERWESEIAAQIPSLVFRATANGKDITDVRIRVDNQVLRDSVDGAELFVDPGIHVFRYERLDGSVVEETLVIRTGEKNRTVDIVFGRPRSGSEAETRRRYTLPLILSLGVSALGFGSTVYFASAAISDENRLRDVGAGGCAPNCDASQVEPVKSNILAANVSLGVGLAGLGAAAVFFLSDSLAPAEPKKTGRTPWNFGWAPVPGGALGAVSGAY